MGLLFFPLQQNWLTVSQIFTGPIVTCKVVGEQSNTARMIMQFCFLNSSRIHMSMSYFTRTFFSKVYNCRDQIKNWLSTGCQPRFRFLVGYVLKFCNDYTIDSWRNSWQDQMPDGNESTEITRYKTLLAFFNCLILAWHFKLGLLWAPSR